MASPPAASKFLTTADVSIDGARSEVGYQTSNQSHLGSHRMRARTMVGAPLQTSDELKGTFGGVEEWILSRLLA